MNETCVLQNFAWRWAVNILQPSTQSGQAERNCSLEGRLTREHKQSALKQWHCFSWKLGQGDQDVNCNHMFSRNIEGSVFPCRRISLCVYYCFDVHHKFLRKGHKIVMTHHKPSCYNTLTVSENCVKNWRIINIKACVWIKKYTAEIPFFLKKKA